MRFGLCCLFINEPVSFRTTTAKALSAQSRGDQLRKLSGICHDNACNLLLALKTVQRLGIGSFRIMSPLFPRMTHPDVGYRQSLWSMMSITIAATPTVSLLKRRPG